MKRRDFLKRTTASGFALALPAIGRPGILEEQLLVGCVGTGGMGWTDRQRISKNPRVRVIALCDVDRNLLGRAAKEVPGARTCTDWRKLLDQKDIDAVTVSIPDHMHAPVIFTALEQGKHVYGQKPLTHSVHEARQIGISARKAGVVTQMGMQVHSTVAYRGIVKTIQAGVIGKVRAVHSWSDRPVWPQGPALKRPTKSHPVPEHFDWNSRLGVAPKRPFVRELYHPGKWRGWVDFGSGALGDMGCHILDPVVWSLQLGAPSAIRSEGPAPTETYPSSSIIHYTFPGTQFTAGDSIDVSWYDGGKRPPSKLAPLPSGKDLHANGSLFIGEKGVLHHLHNGDVGDYSLLPEGDFSGYQKPDLEPHDHWLQWTRACLGKDNASAPFDYSAPLTETGLLGNVALRFPGKELVWAAEKLRFRGFPEADTLVKRPYRKRWEVEGLS